MLPKTMHIPRLLSRIGLAFCFLSIGIWELVDPVSWAGYIPRAFPHIVDPFLLVRVHGIVLCVVGAAVLFGILLPIFAGIGTLMMLEVCISLFVDAGFTDIFIRDIAILFLAASIFADATITARSVIDHSGHH